MAFFLTRVQNVLQTFAPAREKRTYSRNAPASYPGVKHDARVKEALQFWNVLENSDSIMSVLYNTFQNCKGYIAS